MFRIAVAILLLTTAMVHAADKLPDGQSLDLFLLIGQSNMAGRGVPEAEDKTAHPRVWTLTKTNDWAPAVDPLHFDKPTAAGVGPGLSFGKTIAEKQPKSFIGLIPAAVGGTSIDEWNKGDKLYDAAVRRAKAAMAHGKIKGILWHQGEADSEPDAVKAYPAKLAKLIANLRTDLNAPDVPVIVGTLGDFRQPPPTAFNAMIAQTPKLIPHTACVLAAGLKDKNDGRHFTAEAQREFGRRYAAAYLSLIQSDEK